jgi:hypothetical protein
MNTLPNPANIITTRDLLIARRTRREGRKPGKRIKEGSVTVRVFEVREKGRSNRFEVRYFAGGQRLRKKFPGRADAETFAKEQAAALNHGRHIGRGLTAEQASFTVAVIERGERYQRTVHDHRFPIVIIDEALAEKERAHRLGVSVQAALDHWEKTRAPSTTNKLVPEVVKDFLAEIQAASRRQESSLHHWRALTSRLDRFAETFNGPFTAVEKSTVSNWLNGLKTRAGSFLEAKTWNHYRDAIVQWSRYAKEHRYLSAESFTEITSIRRHKIRSEPSEVYTVGEVRRIFHWCQEHEPDLIPGITEVFFCGFRNEEVRSRQKPPADWSHIDFEDEFIAISKRQSKVSCARHAPLMANAKAWLLLHRQDSGLICAKWIDLGRKLMKVCTKLKIPFRENGARHSFISYRVALDRDVAAAADEAGTSVAKVKSTYLKRVTKKDAQEYFTIFPATPMPLFDFASPIRPQPKTPSKKPQ